MSATITMESIRGPVEVSIHRDGTLSGEDLPEAIEYDRAMVEFGEKESQLLRFLEKFSEEPIKAIVEESGLSHHDLVYLAADWAEHVLSLYEKAYKGDSRPRKTIQAARDHVDGKIDKETLEKARGDAARAARALAAARAAARAEDAWAAYAAVYAADAALDASRAEDAGVWAAAVAALGAVYLAADAARAAANAAAYHASPDEEPEEWQAARAAERSWQVRRFVDCMEAIQAGKDWPDLKDTK